MEMSSLWFFVVIISVIVSIASSQTIKDINNGSQNSMTNSRVEQNTKENSSKANDVQDQHNELVTSNDKPHSRKKRLIWITDDGRLALPPGTVLTLTPTISLPLVRYPLEGFLSNMTMSFPLTIDFDKLGLTDNENPLGVLPPLFMGRAAGSYLGLL